MIGVAGGEMTCLGADGRALSQILVNSLKPASGPGVNKPNELRGRMGRTYARDIQTEAPPPSDGPSAWIVAIADRHCREAFTKLFHAFAPRIKAQLMRQGLPSAAAEDVAQETLLAVWRKAAHFDPQRASAEAWIYTVARNQRIDALRREGRFTRPPPHEPGDLAETPEQTLDDNERERHVIVALNALPRPQADLLRLSFFQDHSHGRIAGDLGLPLGTVKSRVRSALQRLRLTLEDGIKA